MKTSSFETERTEQGEQSLVPGVKPVTSREKLQALWGAPLIPRTRQKPCGIGLFDETARNQLDFFVRNIDREDKI